MCAKWVEFLQEYTFVLKHQAGVDNKVADALSRKVALMQSMSVTVTGFERMKDEYSTCPDFGALYTSMVEGTTQNHTGYTLQDGFLFKGCRLCIPRTSMRDFLVWELHAGGVAGHFGRDKTVTLVEDRFYWPSLKHDVAKLLGQCRVCLNAK